MKISCEFVPIASKQLFFFIHISYGSASVVLLILPILLFGKIALCLALLWFWRKSMIYYLSPNYPDRIVRFWHEKENRFGIETAKGFSAIGCLKNDSFKCSWFIILRLKLVPKRHATLARTVTLFIPRDSLSNFEYRILSQSMLFHTKGKNISKLQKPTLI